MLSKTALQMLGRMLKAPGMARLTCQEGAFLAHRLLRFSSAGFHRHKLISHHFDCPIQQVQCLPKRGKLRLRVAEWSSPTTGEEKLHLACLIL